MKLSVQYLHDTKGKARAVQVSISEWEKLLAKLKKYEQTLKIKSDLKEALLQVAKMRKSQVKQPTLSDLINEL